MGIGDEDGAMPAKEGCIYRCMGRRHGAGGRKGAQRIFEPRNFGHRLSPALFEPGIAASRESFVAYMRQCDEAATLRNVTNLLRRIYVKRGSSPIKNIAEMAISSGFLRRFV
jgi:hypothetical protein